MIRSRPIHLALCVALPLALLAHGRASADPAHIWISTCDHAPLGPEVLSINRAENTVDYLHIWAQPMTGKELQNVSLNLVADAGDPAVIDFLDDQIIVHNPPEVVDPDRNGSTLPRFEYVFDSNSDPALASNVSGGAADRIDGLQAFSVDSASYAGIGPDCGTGEPYCEDYGGSDSAWLLASVGYKVIADSGSVEVHLEIGRNGMNHAVYNNTTMEVETEPTSQTMVQFGTGITIDGTERETHDGSAELTITVSATNDGDYNSDGTVDAADYTIWRDTRGSMSDLRADGNNNGTIDSADYRVWECNFGLVAPDGGGSGALADTTVPEPSSLTLLMAVASFWMLAGRRASRG